MKETKLKRLIKKMMDSIFLDAMTPEFKAANAELLKAIKMNDKSGAVPHADLEAINKAMKENDADKAGAALKKVQLQFSKAEKKLDDDVKSVQAKLETTKKASETAKATLKQKKALAPVFDKLKTLVSGLSNNPKNASKLTALTDKVKDYGDLSKRASQIITLVSSNKDASKQIDMLKKAVDAAEKKFKKDLANVEKEAKKSDDALEVAKMQVKITQGKKDAFTKERLYIANVVKQMPGSSLVQNKNSSKADKLLTYISQIDQIMKNAASKAKSGCDEYNERVKSLESISKKVDETKKNVLQELNELGEFSKATKLTVLSRTVKGYINKTKKGEIIWTKPLVAKKSLTVSAEHSPKWGSINGVQTLICKKYIENIAGALEHLKTIVDSVPFDKKSFVSSSPKRLKPKEFIEKTKAGRYIYEDTYNELNEVIQKMKKDVPEFKPPKELGLFKYDYFQNYKPLISCLKEVAKQI